MTAWLIGLAASLVIAGLAYWKKSLSGSGALAAVIVGTLFYAWGNVMWFGTLIAFFISSSLLSKWKQKAKKAAESGYEKTGRRDAGQVLANGGIGLLLCAANWFWPHRMWLPVFIGVMATVNADTWATEIGGASKRQPISILTFKRVPAGTSGGVTWLGLLASALGGAFIGGVASLLGEIGQIAPGGTGGVMWGTFVLFVFVGSLSGLIGSLTDSLLGATVQVMYRCPSCGRDVEARTHCGASTEHVRGLRFCNNDLVNLISSIVGGAVALMLFL
ncbi:DUF92 domain-containing protein [Brevibacillus dissolubilis]|uniref:DUF92 domain-containing protein n=1 Tax=Brevibacillus dissolubilis TaxID=1844116 RepID=UPI0011169DF6|nr:DUF92 domain-containing protein [Brevibacillus dissolubilis]